MSGTNHNMNHIVKRIETRVLAPPGGFSSISFGNAVPTGDIYVGHDFNPKNKNKGICFPSESKNSHNKNSSRRKPVEPADKRNSQQQPDFSRGSRNKVNRFQVTNENENVSAVRRSPNRTRRDSLDELIANPCNPTGGNGDRVIPGLESHYNSRNNSANKSRVGTGNSRSFSPIDTSLYGHNRSKRQSIKEEYEDKLRQQGDALHSSAVANDVGRNSGDGIFNQNVNSQNDTHARRQRQGHSFGRQNVSEFYNDEQQTGNRRTRFGSGGGKSSLSLSWE